tara:strand:+ start:6379 stop:8160 length:1782 start_codon:yes stop_codon:yes gene_type:complete
MAFSLGMFAGGAAAGYTAAEKLRVEREKADREQQAYKDEQELKARYAQAAQPAEVETRVGLGLTKRADNMKDGAGTVYLPSSGSAEDQRSRLQAMVDQGYQLPADTTPMNYQEANAGSRGLGQYAGTEDLRAPQAARDYNAGSVGRMRDVAMGAGKFQDVNALNSIDLAPLQRRGLEQQLRMGEVAYNSANRTETERAAYADAIKAIPAIGSWTKDGEVVPEGTEGATKFDRFDYASAMRSAAQAGGDHNAAGQWGMQAAQHLDNRTTRGLAMAASLADLNKVYSQFDNGKDFVMVKNADGSTSFMHEGDKKPMFTSDKYDTNPLNTFKGLLIAQYQDDPGKLLAFHDKTRAEGMKARELDATLELKKLMASEQSSLRRTIAEGQNSDRDDRRLQSRAQFMANVDATYDKKVPPPDETVVTTKKPESKAKYESDLAKWTASKETYLNHVRNTYDKEMGGKKGAAGAPAAGLGDSARPGSVMDVQPPARTPPAANTQTSQAAPEAPRGVGGSPVVRPPDAYSRALSNSVGGVAEGEDFGRGMRELGAGVADFVRLPGQALDWDMDHQRRTGQWRHPFQTEGWTPVGNSVRDERN